MKSTSVIVGFAITLLGATLLVGGACRRSETQYLSNPPQANLPDDSEVERMRARLFTLDEEKFDTLAEFDVPAEYIPRILFWFRPSHHERGMRSCQENPLGELTIVRKGGETTSIKFFSFGHNPPLFTSNNTDYFVGGGDTKVVIDGHEHGVDGGISAWVIAKKAYLETKKSKE